MTGKTKDGTTTVTIYDPAEGVTPDQLRAQLRKSGVTGRYISLRPNSHDYGLLPRIYTRSGT